MRSLQSCAGSTEAGTFERRGEGTMKNLIRRMLESKALWLASGVVGLAATAALAWRAYSAEVRVFFPDRHPVAIPFEQANLPSLRQVSIASEGRTLGAWYAPAEN